jgi:hypothetical protein
MATRKNIGARESVGVTKDKRIRGSLFPPNLDGLGHYAGTAWEGLIKRLAETKDLKRDPNALFFPGGINRITVTVEGITVAISGPDATVIDGVPKKE